MNTQRKETQEELLELLEARENALRYNKISAIFPEKGPYRRELYKAHMKFIAGTLNHSQCAFIAANRVGKTLTGAYIMTCHLTGIYPSWWTGRKFINPIEAWVAGTTNEATKDIIQKELLGPDDDMGSGMIPKHLLIEDEITKKPGVGDAVLSIKVKHSSGGTSYLTFKSYEQRRVGFQGTKKQVIWLDEEPKEHGIYSECLIRLMDEHAPGIMICTFTPLFGLSDIVMGFLPEGKAPIHGTCPDNPDKFSVQATWDDAPHITDKAKKIAWDGCLPHEREARSKGIPSLGAGAIYPYLEENVTCDPFEIPAWWPKAYGLDTRFGCTAALWGAMNPDTKVIYIYSEHYVKDQLPAINASAIKKRGNWMIGAADPAGANITDGKRIFDIYAYDEGLNLVKADKENREGGILEVSQLFASGQLKIFNSLLNTLNEFRIYRRDEDGKIIKKKDDAMDALRYLIHAFHDIATVPNDPDETSQYNGFSDRDQYTGY